MGEIKELAGLLFLVGSAVAQVKSVQATDREIFLLKDDQNQQWCGYSTKAESKSEGERLNAMLVVGVEYSGERVSAIHITEGDESGDWNVDDRYSVDKSGSLLTVSRVIDNFSLGITQEESFQIQNGKAVKQTTRSRARRTGEVTKELSGDYLPDVPVITNLRSFPFWYFLMEKQREVGLKGHACLAVSRRSP